MRLPIQQWLDEDDKLYEETLRSKILEQIVAAYYEKIRKQLLEFDDVANEQRKVIYHMRNTLLSAEDVGETIKEFREETLSATCWNSMT